MDLYAKDSFVCPNCSVLAQQTWHQVVFKEEHRVDEYGFTETVSFYAIDDDVRVYFHDGETLKEPNVVAFCMCHSCKNYSLWSDHTLIYPIKSFVPPARDLMPDEVKKLYQEASAVFNSSPRASVALLRLALELLLPHLGAKKGNINSMISQLVNERKAIGRIQEAMDTLRVIGNNAVHPGEIIFEGQGDDENQRKTAASLFEILNYIVTETIEADLTIKNLYSQLPEKVLKGIDDRDKKSK